MMFSFQTRLMREALKKLAINKELQEASRQRTEEIAKKEVIAEQPKPSGVPTSQITRSGSTGATSFWGRLFSGGIGSAGMAPTMIGASAQPPQGVTEAEVSFMDRQTLGVQNSTLALVGAGALAAYFIFK